jgi:hypothetical protein
VNLDAAGRTTLSSGTVRSSGGIDVDSGGLVTAVDAELDASDASYGSISLTGADVSIERATVLTEGPITVTSAAALDATAADLESTGNGQTIALGSSGDMVLERGEISVGPDGTMTGELNQGRNDLTVSDAAFRQDGGPGTFDYSPNGVTVIGDPAVGSTR